MTCLSWCFPIAFRNLDNVLVVFNHCTLHWNGGARLYPWQQQKGEDLSKDIPSELDRLHCLRSLLYSQQRVSGLASRHINTRMWWTLESELGPGSRVLPCSNFKAQPQVLILAPSSLSVGGGTPTRRRGQETLSGTRYLWRGTVWQARLQLSRHRVEDICLGSYLKENFRWCEWCQLVKVVLHYIAETNREIKQSPFVLTDHNSGASWMCNKVRVHTGGQSYRATSRLKWLN